MPLSAGARLGPYEILAPLGAGGMGEVYKARDTRLDRTVAVKICAGRFTDRFEREARVISSLNHPNICALYDVGHQDSGGFLVMEYIEGESLETRLAHGPLPVAEAVEIAIQVAGALDAAHCKWGISTAAGTEPRWRHDGKELYFVAGSTLMAVDVKTDGRSFEAGIPKALFGVHVPDGGKNHFLATRDGQRFLVNTSLDESSITPMHVLVNWR